MSCGACCSSHLGQPPLPREQGLNLTRLQRWGWSRGWAGVESLGSTSRRLSPGAAQDTLQELPARRLQVMCKTQFWRNTKEWGSGSAPPWILGGASGCGELPPAV